jgi:hypothetical protein
MRTCLLLQERSVCHPLSGVLCQIVAELTVMNVLVILLVYPADMPEKLPIPVRAVRFSKDAVRTIVYCGWVIVVATAWLVVLPLIVKGVWGGLFSGGSSM